MATWTQSVSGNVVTYTVTDQEGSTGTIAVTKGAVTGFTSALSSTTLHNDGLQTMISLLQQISTNLLPNQPPSSSSSFS